MISQMKRMQRGYSILAALVFVGILGSVAAAVHVASPSSGQSASAIYATISPAGNALDALRGINQPNPPDQQSQGQKQECNPGYDYKIKRASDAKPKVTAIPVCPPPGVGPTGPIQTKISMTASIASVFGKPDDIRCQRNSRTNQLEPRPGYKCKVQYCVQFGQGKEECKDADSLATAGIDADQIDKSLRKQTIQDFIKATHTFASALY